MLSLKNSEIGTVLLARKDFWMFDRSYRALTKNKKYIIKGERSFDDGMHIYLYDDRGQKHHFHRNLLDKYFMNIKYERKLKLERISNYEI
jgi:hypothetical protein